MKKIALLALAAATSAAIATPSYAAVANVTGTINISGSVASKCAVVAGESIGGTFGATIDMGELSGDDGTLLPTGTLAGKFVTQTAGANIARVVCTTLNPTISVDADPLVNSTAAVTGYVNTVQFQANVAVQRATLATANITNDTTAAAATSSALGDALAATGNNVTITTSNWRTVSNSGQQMVAGNYNNGKITVTISPL